MERIITEEVYQTALERIEELLPTVSDATPTYDRKAIELKIMSDIVIEYEECHFPIGNPSLPEVVKMRLEQEEMSQREFAKKLGVSPSRVSEYLTGKSEPSLKIARNISKILNIEPAIILGI
ncbi:MAG: helix-turn-helix domain-containing protein [bacterium]|jgi:HTH-type transcriptional regulator/antitoxin HigA